MFDVVCLLFSVLCSLLVAARSMLRPEVGQGQRRPQPGCGSRTLPRGTLRFDFPPQRKKPIGEGTSLSSHFEAPDLGKPIWEDLSWPQMFSRSFVRFCGLTVSDFYSCPFLSADFLNRFVPIARRHGNHHAINASKTSTV